MTASASRRATTEPMTAARLAELALRYDRTSGPDVIVQELVAEVRRLRAAVVSNGRYKIVRRDERFLSFLDHCGVCGASSAFICTTGAHRYPRCELHAQVWAIGHGMVLP